MKQVRIIPTIVMLLLALTARAFSIDVAPHFIGNASTDSVYVTFTSVDTTYYPVALDLDSFTVLRFAPDATILDSLGDDNARVKNLRTGFYRVAYRGSDGSGTQGTYTVLVQGWRAGAIRGVSSTVYHVIDDNVGTYLAFLNATISSRSDYDPTSDPVIVEEIKSNTLADSTLDDGATEYRDAVWTAVQKDSVLSRLVTALERATYWGECDGCIVRIAFDSIRVVDTTASGADTLVRSIYFEYDVDSTLTEQRTVFW